MQTHFTPHQLTDPDIAEADSILRGCVHCGFCTATCPTYVLLGDELDSPRGRIYLIKDMLENEKPASKEVTTHVDRCLSCLACMTTCPSGVHYMHLVDQARAHIENTGSRPWSDRLLRWLLAVILPHPGKFRLAILASRLIKPFARALPKRLRAMVTLAPKTLPAPSPQDSPQVFPADGKRTLRVALLTGCAQRALSPEINEATIRLLTRHGAEVAVVKGAGCCGALTHHMGMTERSREFASKNIRVWAHEMDTEGLDAIVINTSGCGTTVKDYGHMFRNDITLARDATRVSSIAKDISEVLSALNLRPLGTRLSMRVAYQAACSLQHGQQIKSQPQSLLRSAGFDVVEPIEAHLCCGSAGSYNILQPDIAAQLKGRKIANIEHTTPDVIASGNIGCITQLHTGTNIPVVHTAELLDWATGGPKPAKLKR
jgi:glycolate oxidase iron-sulfur subunit